MKRLRTADHRCLLRCMPTQPFLISHHKKVLWTSRFFGTFSPRSFPALCCPDCCGPTPTSASWLTPHTALRAQCSLGATFSSDLGLTSEQRSLPGEDFPLRWTFVSVQIDVCHNWRDCYWYVRGLRPGVLLNLLQCTEQSP